MLNGKLLGSQMVSQLASKGLVGESLPSFSMALGEGIVESFKIMNQVITQDTGLMSFGKGKGKILGLSPMLMYSLALPQVLAGGMVGPASAPMTEALCNAIIMHFTLLGEAETSHVGVSNGTGIGKISGLTPAPMTANVLSKMASKNFSGPNLTPLVKAICNSFCAHLLATGTVPVVIVGIPSPLVLGVPVPGTGIGSGKIL